MAGNESPAAVDMHYGTLYRYCFPFVLPVPRLSRPRRRRRRRSAFNGSKRTILLAIAWHRVASSVFGFRRIHDTKNRDVCLPFSMEIEMVNRLDEKIPMRF